MLDEFIILFSFLIKLNLRRLAITILMMTIICSFVRSLIRFVFSFFFNYFSNAISYFSTTPTRSASHIQNRNIASGICFFVLLLLLQLFLKSPIYLLNLPARSYPNNETNNENKNAFFS